MNKKKLIGILKNEMIPAMGCTEPAAGALAGAKSREILGTADILKVEVFASRDMVKNAMGVGLPNCSLKGILAAVGLGIACGDTSKKLSILSSISEDQIRFAESLDSALTLVRDVPPLYVKVRLESATSSAVATISGEHDRYAYLEKDGEVLLDLPLSVESQNAETSDRNTLSQLSLSDIVAFADKVTAKDVPFILEAVDVNMAIAKHSISGNYGLQVGKTMAGKVRAVPKSLDEAFRLGSSLAAAGSDARMSGCSMPVVINSGSGNQGITVTVPVKVVSDFLDKTENGLVKAVCVSELVGLVLTARKDRLSALCGAFTASIGTACAYCYLLGGRESEMDYCINSMVGNLTGIICDGAKNTCALKIYSCLEAAAMSVSLAFRGFYPGKESGIVGETSWDSIDSLSRITKEGMESTDKTILEIMIEKNC